MALITTLVDRTVSVIVPTMVPIMTSAKPTVLERVPMTVLTMMSAAIVARTRAASQVTTARGLELLTQLFTNLEFLQVCDVGPLT